MAKTPQSSSRIRARFAFPTWAVRVVPGLAWMQSYQAVWLRYDVFAGVTVAAVILPIALAYGDLAGLPAIAGIYASILPLVAYALFGTSRQLILGPDSASAALVGAAIIPLAGGNLERYAALAAMLAIIVGFLSLLGGIARMGFSADFLSRPILVGYMNGLALTIIAGQLQRIFGIRIESGAFFGQIGEWLSKPGQTHLPTLALGAGVLILVVVLRQVAPRIPAALISVILSTILVAVFRLDAHGVATLGRIPSGLPAIRAPAIHLSDIAPLFADALGILILTFSDTILNARSFAAQAHTTVDANKELIGLGTAQIAAGFSQGFPISASGARTAVNVSVGGKTQLTSIIAALVLVITLLFLTAPLERFPHAALGAILVAAVINLLDVKTFVILYRVRKLEFAIALITLLGVLTIGLLNGIILAIVLSLLVLLFQAVRPHDAVLGRVKALDGFHDIGDYPNSETIPGLIVYRFDAPLFFANANFLKERIQAILDETNPPVQWFILDAEAITDLDFTAAEVLIEIRDILTERHITFAVARAKHHLRDMLTRTHLTEAIGENHLYPSIRTSVAAFLKSRERATPD
jgi:high affinity sulfate transporter 1